MLISMDRTALKLKPTSLTIGIYNANGLRGMKDEVMNFLRDHSVDIFLVQETFYRPGTRAFRVPGFNQIRDDRQDGRPFGGTLIFYKRNLHCISLTPPPLTNMEVSVCRISMQGHPPISIASTYLSPQRDLLKTDLDSLASLGPSVIVAGDLNSKHINWGCTATNPNGNRLHHLLIDSLPFDLLAPLEPTHFPHNVEHRPDILDIALLKNVALTLRSIEVLHELDSDHRPVLLRLGPHPSSTPRTRTLVDWDKVQSGLLQTDPPLLRDIPDTITTTDETDQAIDSFTNYLNTVRSEASREVSAEDIQNRPLPREVRELVTRKNRAIRTYSNHPSAENRQILRDLCKESKQRIAEFRENSFRELMGEIAPSHLAYWKLARSLKSDTCWTIPPLDRPDHPTPAFEDSEKAECLASSLESQCSPSLLHTDEAHIRWVDSEVDRRSRLPVTSPVLPVSVKEVSDLVRRLRVRKAPGADGVSNRILRLLPETLLLILVGIFNAALTNAHFPAAWKGASVIGIAKPGKPRTSPASYRPISLLSSLGKLYERILLTRILRFTAENNVIIDEQFGFRSGHSCVQQVHRVTEHVLDGFSRFQGLKTGAIFLDVAKAFDKVWHNGLIYKLYLLGMPDRLVLTIRDFLRDRSFRYRLEGTYSDPHPIRAGVPQGSVLSPTLYSLFTNDIPRHPKVHLGLFADDTALFTTHCKYAFIRRYLQEAITDLGRWFNLWRIEVNPEKSTAIVFHPSDCVSTERRVAPIQMFDRPIPWANEVKYLGVTLDRKLTFRSHIRRVRNRALFVLGRLGPMINKFSKMSLRNKLTLYKTCVRPIMSYASVAFAHVPMTSLKPLQVIQNRFLRRATGAPWYQSNLSLHHDMGISTMYGFFKQTARRYFDNAPHHRNPLVRKAVDYVPIPPPSVVTRRSLIRGRTVRRPRHTLTDPDDVITASIERWNAALTASNSDTTRTLRLSRRRGRPPRDRDNTDTYSPYSSRYRRIPGRVSPTQVGPS